MTIKVTKPALLDVGFSEEEADLIITTNFIFLPGWVCVHARNDLLGELYYDCLGDYEKKNNLVSIFHDSGMEIVVLRMGATFGLRPSRKNL